MHYKPLFPSCVVTGLDYKASTPWEAGKEIKQAVKQLRQNHDRVILIANSIGAFFCMHADIEQDVAHAYFISPIVEMEKLIEDGLRRAGITQTMLQEKGIVHTDFGEDLSWEYFCYVREHPLAWSVPTDILCASEDHLCSADTISAFARKHAASVTVMKNGEHWFHTDAQMRFLDQWLMEKEKN